jgi:pimeloyl-ACP methyl ester carboxylesterase
MFVKEYGSGEQVFLCVHGWGGDHREFAPLASRSPDHVRLLSIDLPGYGRSPKPGVWSLDAIIDDVLSITENRDIRGVIGFCSGAVLALMIAARTAGKMRRVVMIDPFAFMPWYFRLFLYGEFGRHAYAATFQTSTGRKITDWVLKRLQTSDADFTKSFTNLDHDVTLRYLQMLSHIDIYKRFSGLNADIDILHGEHTFGAVRRSVEIFEGLLPQAKTKELRGVGHLPMIRGARQLSAFIFEESDGPGLETDVTGREQNQGVKIP